MKNFVKAFGIAAIGVAAIQLPSQAENATRAAYAEVRPNGSSFAAALEIVAPDAVPTVIIDPSVEIVFQDGTSGTNQVGLSTLSVLGVEYNSVDNDAQTIEAAIARSIDAGAFDLAEDITGFIRAFVGPEGFSGADAGATLD